MNSIDTFVYLVTHEYVIAISVIVGAIVLIKNNKKIAAAEILYSSILVSFVGLLLKMLWRIPRPEEALVEVVSYGFPSIHSAWIVSICALIYFLWIRKMRSKRVVIIADILLITTIIVIGASRIWLGVHSVEDVVGGYAFGLIVALVVFSAFRLVASRKS